MRALFQAMHADGPRGVGRMLVLAWLGGAGLLAAAELPPPATDPVRFERDIRPLLAEACLRCHGPDRARSGFRLDTREHALAGGDNQARDLIPGDSAASPLIRYVAGLEPEMHMPPPGRGEPLTPEQVGMLRRWVDDGAPWGGRSIAGRAPASYVAEVGAGGFAVEGNAARFREHFRRNDGGYGGLRRFALVQPLDDDTTLTADGHALAGQEDYRVRLELKRRDTGFVRGGFQVARQWYDDLGGRHPPFGIVPRLDRDLFLDTGRAWIEAGFARAHLPRVVAGYEYRFRDGVRSTLQWGLWSPAPGLDPKSVYPAAQEVDEGTHRLKLDVSHELAGVFLEDNFRAEFFELRTRRRNAGSGAPDATEDYAEDYRHTRLANTLRGEKQVTSWLFASAGYLHADLDGNSAFQQAFDLGAAGRFPGDRSRRIALNQETQAANANVRLGPWQRTSLSVGVQSDWSRQRGLTDLLQPGFPEDTPAAFQTGLDRVALDERLGLRCDLAPYTVLYADARLRQEWLDYSERGAVLDDFADGRDFLRDTDERSDLRDVTAGARFSPTARLSLQPWYRHRGRERRFAHPVDADGSEAPFARSGSGYPAFLRRLDTVTDAVGGRLSARLSRWLRARFRVELAETEYRNETDDVFLPGFPAGTLLPGGRLVSGRESADTYSLGAVLSPWRRWRFSVDGSYRGSELRTPVGDDGLVAPYAGRGWNVLAGMTWLLDARSDLRLSYRYGTADYAQTSATVPTYGARYEQHGVRVGLSRRFKPGLTGALQYAFHTYREPTLGTAADYTAHGLFASLTVRLP